MNSRGKDGRVKRSKIFLSSRERRKEGAERYLKRKQLRIFNEQSQKIPSILNKNKCKL